MFQNYLFGRHPNWLGRGFEIRRGSRRLGFESLAFRHFKD